MNHQKELAEVKLAALDATANGVVITRADGTIEWANPAIESLTGYRPEELIGGNPRTLRSGMQGPDVYGELWATITRGDTWHGRIINKRKDGSFYHEQMTITPVRSGPDNEITHFVAIKRDVSAEVLAANQRDQIRNRFEKTVEILTDTLMESVRVLANLAEIQAPDIGRHGRRVGDLSLEVGLMMGIDPKRLQDIWSAGILHDIGKAIVPKTRYKAVRHSAEERFEHAVQGAQLLTPIGAALAVQTMIRHHHERVDGTGYPDGLRGKAIPVGARIIAVASAYDHSVHIAGLTPDQGLERIEGNTGTLFDPAVVEALHSVVGGGSRLSDNDHDILISVCDLMPGMKLAEPLLGATGKLLLPASRTLNTSDRKRLVRYSGREAPVGFIRVAPRIRATE